ncbi:hypothetical protein Gpo141_00005516 [Globisporangium polare]
MSTSGGGKGGIAPSGLSVYQVPAAHMGTSSSRASNHSSSGSASAPAVSVVAGSMSVYQVPAAQMGGMGAGITFGNNSNNRNGGSAVAASSFSVFQVPAAAAVIPMNASNRGHNSYSSTLSSSGSFDDQQQPPSYPQVTVPVVFGGPPVGGVTTGVADVFATPMDDSYFTHSGRNLRGSISVNNRFGSGNNLNGQINNESETRGGIGWMRTGRVIRVKETGESFRFPLEDDHLPRVALTPEQYDVLKKRAVQLAEQAIGSNHIWMENPTLSPQLKKQNWKVHLEKKNCVIYRQRGTDTKHAQSRNVLVRAKLDCTLDELAYAVNNDNTDDQRIWMAHCYQDSFLDGAVLHVAETASFEDPFQFLGVKWLAFQSSVDSVYAVRDMLVVELCKTFKDAKGQKILARVCQSVNLKDFKGSERNFGFVRNQISWVHLFRSLGPGSGRVDASLSSTTQFSGKATPAWVANRIVSGMYNFVLNLSTCADAKYIVKSRLITDRAWVPNNERPACSVCFKSFNLLRSRHHCRVCAEIMCTSCTMELTILSSKLPPGMQPETGANLITSTEKFCLKCVNKCRQDRRNALLALLENQSAFAAAEETYEVNSYGRQSDMFFDERSSTSSDLVVGNSSSSSNGDSVPEHPQGNGINYYGWGSSKNVSSALSTRPGDIIVEEDLRSATQQVKGLRIQFDTRQNNSNNINNNNTVERRRQNSNASASSAYSDSSSHSQGGWEHREKENYGGNNTNGMILLEEADEVVNPIPTSFVKMEESIAAQQALLRSMMMEGQKIMQKQTHTQYRPPPPPQNEFITLEGHQQRLALPPSSSAFIEDIE